MLKSALKRKKEWATWATKYYLFLFSSIVERQGERRPKIGKKKFRILHCLDLL